MIGVAIYIITRALNSVQTRQLATSRGLVLPALTLHNDTFIYIYIYIYVCIHT